MIILISGSVGTGKTSIADLLGSKLNFEVVNLNERAKEYKLEDVDSLQTFDFDLDALVDDVNSEVKSSIKENRSLILESHFSHFIKPEFVDILFVINRDLKELEKEYEKRGYNEQKVKDNLEAESFNVCFYEAIEEGYEEEKQVFAISNDKDLNLAVDEIVNKIKND